MANEKDPLQAVLQKYETRLSELRFMSLAGRTLVIDRDPIRERVQRGGEIYTEVRQRDNFKFEDGFYPPAGQVLTEDAARELVESPFFDLNPRSKKALFRVAPKAPAAAQSIEDRIEQIAEARAQQRLAELLAERERQETRTFGEETRNPAVGEGRSASPPVQPQPPATSPGAPQAGELTPIAGVSTKQEAIEQLALLGVDVAALAAGLGRVTIPDIVAFARERGYRFLDWGE